MPPSNGVSDSTSAYCEQPFRTETISKPQYHDALYYKFLPRTFDPIIVLELPMENERFSDPHEAIIFARENSTFYKRLYQSVPDEEPALEDVPVIYPDDYWESANNDLSSVMTGPFTNGKTYCTSGPSDKLEIVHLSKEEGFEISRTRCNLWARTLNFDKAKRIAYIMSPHDIRISFWDTLNISSGMLLPKDAIQLFISNEKMPSKIAEEVERFQPYLLFGSLPDMFRLSEYLVESHIALPSVRTILYQGKTVPKHINISLHAGFPNARLYAPLYDKPQIGPLATPGPISTGKNLDIDPIYRVSSCVAVLEIVADDGVAIKEPGIKGNVVITHLVRRLQPLIRFPVGDVAEWLDYNARIFRYCSQAPTKIKIANTTLDCSTLKDIIRGVTETDVSGRFQCVLRVQDGRQKLVLRLAYPKPQEAGEIRHKIEKALWNTSSSWKSDRQADVILNLRLEWVDSGQLTCDWETGEILEVVDERS
ncbi:uncharacterized protein F4812DRAFT_461544 [Daldinia caldariorum]|uniref:uncharacterized protein n=1 Tax=Daldinia caldariorum TaxID=326644 RepID=UPI002007BF12|nr:uncharacterized protein F4812DRAFT_461544 [Daldinia caldariorum]KAI1465857.1 hypothetical protein F4812DRAFT_461544 [Daldinia caldariorum]